LGSRFGTERGRKGKRRERKEWKRQEGKRVERKGGRSEEEEEGCPKTHFCLRPWYIEMRQNSKSFAQIPA